MGLLFLSQKLFTTGPLDSLFILHNVNLIFHEAGHIIFGIFGEFVGFLGGALGQLIVPLIFVVAFFMKRQLFSSLVMLWWFGENCKIQLGIAQTFHRHKNTIRKKGNLWIQET